MASISQSAAASFFLLTIFLSIISNALAARAIPKYAGNHHNQDKKQPQNLLGFDGSVLIPGVGRVIIPSKHSHVNPTTYNPVTGGNEGPGITIPVIGSINRPDPGTTRQYVPGNDDTFLPNPGFEVPIAGDGATIPTPTIGGGGGGGGFPTPAVVGGGLPTPATAARP